MDTTKHYSTDAPRDSDQAAIFRPPVRRPGGNRRNDQQRSYHGSSGSVGPSRRHGDVVRQAVVNGDDDPPLSQSTPRIRGSGLDEDSSRGEVRHVPESVHKKRRAATAKPPPPGNNNESHYNEPPQSDKGANRRRSGGYDEDRVHSNRSSEERQLPDNGRNERNIRDRSASGERSRRDRRDRPTEDGVGYQGDRPRSRSRTDDNHRSSKERRHSNRNSQERDPSNHNSQERGSINHRSRERGLDSRSSQEHLPSNRRSQERVSGNRNSQERDPSNHNSQARGPIHHRSRERGLDSRNSQEHLPSNRRSQERVSGNRNSQERGPRNHNSHDRGPSNRNSHERGRHGSADDPKRSRVVPSDVGHPTSRAHQDRVRSNRPERDPVMLPNQGVPSKASSYGTGYGSNDGRGDILPCSAQNNNYVPPYSPGIESIRFVDSPTTPGSPYGKWDNPFIPPAPLAEGSPGQMEFTANMDEDPDASNAELNSFSQKLKRLSASGRPANRGSWFGGESVPLQKPPKRESRDGAHKAKAEVRRGGCRASGAACVRHTVRSPTTWVGLGCFGATLMFLLAMNADYLPFVEEPMVGNLLPRDHVSWVPDPISVLALVVLWGCHFLRRFGEVFFLHDFRRRLRIVEALGVNLYYWGFGFWVGYSCNFTIGYRTPKNYILFPAILVFLCGEAGNCWCHVALRRLRQSRDDAEMMTSPESRHVMPTGRPFRWISCPHYLFEMVTWVGFSLVAFTMPCFIFCGLNLVVLLVYARLRHVAYRREFDGRDGRPLYDPKRKAVIPFIF